MSFLNSARGVTALRCMLFNVSFSGSFRHLIDLYIRALQWLLLRLSQLRVSLPVTGVPCRAGVLSNGFKFNSGFQQISFPPKRVIPEIGRGPSASAQRERGNTGRVQLSAGLLPIQDAAGCVRIRREFEIYSYFFVSAIEAGRRRRAMSAAATLAAAVADLRVQLRAQQEAATAAAAASGQSLAEARAAADVF